MTDPETIAKGLSEAQQAVITHPRFDAKGWEPRNPFCPLIESMVVAGLLRRADGRCGFERLKNSFVVPTIGCLAVRAILGRDAGNG